jgi:virulence-associated protein VapD
MFAIAFDLAVADAEAHHPKGFQAAYLDIESWSDVTHLVKGKI